ncbi:1839_t:CDS:2, partial [Scutellospora calospora]
QPNSEQPIRSLTSLLPSPNLVPNYLSLTSTNEELWTEIKLLNKNQHSKQVENLELLMSEESLRLLREVEED